VAEVLKDPTNVPLLIPADPWYSETVYGHEINRWIKDNGVEADFEFSDGQCVVIKDRGSAPWSELLDKREEVGSQTLGGPHGVSKPASEGTASWPWGTHETVLLRKLRAAAERFWVNYDPGDATTAPTNAQVIAWLKSQGVAERTAEVMATILRIDGLPTGPRK
jgi:hypothetical protein